MGLIGFVIVWAGRYAVIEKITAALTGSFWAGLIIGPVIAGALGERRSRVAAVVPVGTHVLGDRIAQAIKHGGTVAFGNGHIICHVLGHRTSSSFAG